MMMRCILFYDFIVVSYILHIYVCAKVGFDSVISVGDTEDSFNSDLKFRFVQVLSCIIIITRAWSSLLVWSNVFVCGFVKVCN